MEKRVTTIPATLNRYSKKPVNSIKKRRVAGYGRVSTDSEEQASSYEAQVDYYTNYIQSREDWEFAGMYTDEGITGTSTKKRTGFQEMVDDALAGKIDLIITKSISRFARNTVDSLVTVRMLKEKGVEIYFEKENIWTLDSKGELLITIMSSLAQEESRSISENTTWGKRKSFSDGNASVGFKNFLGYDRGENGEFVVNPEQAKTVQLIYKLFLEGYSGYKIGLMLTEQGVLTPMRKKKWQTTTVMSILQNEKYKGDALLQKNYTEDFLTKKQKKNNGEIPQYYVEGHHEAIISPETFDLVQAEILKRKNMDGRYSGVGIFSSKIKCGECGCWFGSKVWHSNDKYRRGIYRCNSKFKGDKKCETPHITEDEIKDAFISATNQLITDKDEILANIGAIIDIACNTESLETKESDLQDKMSVLVERVKKCISENAQTVQDQEAYQKKYDDLVGRYENTKAEHDKVTDAITAKNDKREIIQGFMRGLEQQEGMLTEFDESLWGCLVEYITVNKDEILVTFRDGTEIQA